MPQIITGVVVSVCCLLVTFFVNQGMKKLDNIATKDYVRNELVEQSRQLGEMFVNATTQNQVNATMEQRLRYVEDQIWSRFERMLAMALSTAKETAQNLKAVSER